MGLKGVYGRKGRVASDAHCTVAMSQKKIRGWIGIREASLIRLGGLRTAPKDIRCRAGRNGDQDVVL